MEFNEWENIYKKKNKKKFIFKEKTINEFNYTINNKYNNNISEGIIKK